MTESITTKSVSKKDQAFAIFQNKLAEKSQGLFGSNKEFRSAVLSSFQTSMSVSTASAATMYNAAKKAAESAGVVALGRDPKKVKTSAGNGRRGRPAGSKNRPKAAAEQAAA